MLRLHIIICFWSEAVVSYGTIKVGSFMTVKLMKNPMNVQTRKKTKNLTRRRKTMMLFSTYLKKQ